jgi:cold shock CspA family protein
MDGSVELWNQSGYGIIRGSDGREYFAHFTDFVRFQKTGARISVEVGDDVSFTPAMDRERGNRAKAADIQYDSRSPLFRFAFFPNFEESIADLAERHARRERWSSSTFDEQSALQEICEAAERNAWLSAELNRQLEKYGSTDAAKAERAVERRVSRTLLHQKYNVLFSYFERTFERAQLEKKIIHSADGTAFNTGLGNKFDRDVFAVFRKQPDPAGYVFDRFADENFVGKHFPQIPEAVNYFYDPESGERVPVDHLIFDFEMDLYPDYTHLLDDRRSRFPESWQGMNDLECTETFDILLSRTRSRVRRNFHAAVPFYYPALRRIQLLLPLTFNPGTPQEETRALVASREGAGYSVETIMPLQWAYRNARLMTKPDRDDWLDF